jgi:RimJ/RimL family protein N-acetyltransferase
MNTDQLNISESLKFLSAVEADLDLTYSWANDAESRENSFSKDKISRETHAKWFYKKIADPDCTFLICYSDQLPIGQVRFDRLTADCYIVSFGVVAEMRGKGIGERLLSGGVDKLKELLQTELAIIGFVKHSNTASIRIFEKLGFKKEEATEYPNAYRFELKITKRQLTM